MGSQEGKQDCFCATAGAAARRTSAATSAGAAAGRRARRRDDPRLTSSPRVPMIGDIAPYSVSYTRRQAWSRSQRTRGGVAQVLLLYLDLDVVRVLVLHAVA